MRILCATDLLPKSEAAIDRAGLLADLVGADLTLLHVVSLEETQGVLEERLRMAVETVKSRVRPPLWTAECTPEVGVLPGHPARLILDAVEESKARLLVLGPHQRRPWRDMWEGTLVEKAIESRQCPVLIVRDAPRGPYRRVLLALDTSDASATALNAAATLVLTPETSAQVVHVHMPAYAGIPDSDLKALEEESVQSVRGLLGRERAYLADIEVRTVRGAPANGILSSIEKYQPELLVMGTRGMGRMRRALVGSVASRVFQEAQRDMLIVPEWSFVAPVHRRWGQRELTNTRVRINTHEL